jgi:hypothetical protein
MFFMILFELTEVDGVGRLSKDLVSSWMAFEARSPSMVSKKAWEWMI